ncbi:zf-HC2 domain-containing protein [Frankia sp. CiP3]|uniref:zf-HC2 domain-containing protein n=1 Tax=Frankia sp. CiP3 TaxID=2880971 RepID=UPI001EF456CF|nr:zf-HC2 domain-containing protein [Frankia sp. CiP3]
MTTDVEYRRALGAYLLGALEPEEEARLEEHVRSCESCHAELLDLGDTVADLAAGTMTEEDAVVGPPTPDTIPAGPPLAGLPPNALPRRLLFAVAAAAATGVATAGAVGFAMGNSNSAAPVPVAAPTPSVGVRTVEGSDTKTAVTGRAVLTPAVWGTGIQLTVAGTQRAVAAGERCRLVAVSHKGIQDIAGTWVVPPHSPTPAGERISGAVGIPIEHIATLMIITPDGQEILAVPV